MLIFEIDQLPWPMESGVRGQAWPTSVDPEWTGPLCRAMGAVSAVPTLVFELWHTRGEVLPGDLHGASALMALGGDAVLRQRDFSLLLPRGTAVQWPQGSTGTSADWYVPRQRQVRWGGTAADWWGVCRCAPTMHRLLVVEVSLGGGTPGATGGSSQAGPGSPLAGAGTSMGAFC